MRSTTCKSRAPQIAQHAQQQNQIEIHTHITHYTVPSRAIVKRTRSERINSVKTTSHPHLQLKLPILIAETLWSPEENAVSSHNLNSAQTKSTQQPPPLRTPCWLPLFAFCACVNYHNKPANSACWPVADTSSNSYQNENISNNCKLPLIVHIIRELFQ